MPSCLQAKQPADVDDGEGIVRPIASKSAIALHLRFPIHKGASFLFLHVKVGFVITKTLLATEREQPKAASTSKGTNSTKKQQFDRKSQAFAGYLQAFAGKVHPLQTPDFILHLPDFILHLPDFILQIPDFS
ncbi:hypothetical protein QUA00_31225 [Microcoleus sp. T2B6]|uniref:hypothetical protein n=1 Tax=unclassified Microcoleus TaxID=2642155 RepID=UPI002FCED533